MSAYDDLYSEIGESRRLGHMSDGWAQVARDLDAALDEHAHKLAEKIRYAFEDAFDANQEVLSGTDAMLAADLIDPESPTCA